jgi:hypothetical protein
MEEGNLAILVDAKTEYTKQLVNILKNSIYLGIKEIYINSKEKCMVNENDILSVFQVNLSEIPKWNQDIINTKTETVVKDSGCDWIEDLITAVFVSHTRILTSINFSKNKKKINLKIPKVDHFIHQCYVDAARYFWKNPYLYDDAIGSYEYQRNRREAETIIENSIGETIRKQLPVKHILKEYLGNEYNDKESGESEDVTKNIPENYQENLRKMVKAEILQCSEEQKNKVSFSDEVSVSEENSNVSTDSTNETNSGPIVEELTFNAEEPANDLQTTEEPTTEASLVEPEGPLVTTTFSEPETTAAPEVLKSSEPVIEATEGLELSSTTPPVTNIEPALESVPTLEDKSAIVLETKVEEQPKIELSSNTTPVIEKAPELNLDTMINTELNNVSNVNDLVVEDLNLDMDDLSKLEEIYIDEPKETNVTMKTEQIDLNEFSTEEKSRPATPTPTPKESEDQVKTIVLDTNEEIKKQLKKKDYSFFEDATIN